MNKKLFKSLKNRMLRVKVKPEKEGLGVCYKDDKGNIDPILWHIGESNYDERIEGIPIEQLEKNYLDSRKKDCEFFKGVLKKKKCCLKTLISIQYIHDEFDVNDWEEELNKFYSSIQ